jgi:hypothetical protein
MMVTAQEIPQLIRLCRLIRNRSLKWAQEILVDILSHPLDLDHIALHVISKRLCREFMAEPTDHFFKLRQPILRCLKLGIILNHHLTSTSPRFVNALVTDSPSSSIDKKGMDPVALVSDVGLQHAAGCVLLRPGDAAKLFTRRYLTLAQLIGTCQRPLAFLE